MTDIKPYIIVFYPITWAEAVQPAGIPYIILATSRHTFSGVSDIRKHRLMGYFLMNSLRETQQFYKDHRVSAVLGSTATIVPRY